MYLPRMCCTRTQIITDVSNVSSVTQVQQQNSTFNILDLLSNTHRDFGVGGGG